MSSPTNVRFPDAVDRALRAYTMTTGRTKASVITEALGEWLKLQGHPLIRFVTTANGERRAALSGGPEVWTVVESWLAHDLDRRTVTSVADATGLDHQMVEAALAYWADNRGEIESVIERVQASQEQAYEAWVRRQAVLHPAN